jgi:hypothetical protein
MTYAHIKLTMHVYADAWDNKGELTVVMDGRTVTQELTREQIAAIKQIIADEGIEVRA